jgi:hypothetical protein
MPLDERFGYYTPFHRVVHSPPEAIANRQNSTSYKATTSSERVQGHRMCRRFSRKSTGASWLNGLLDSCDGPSLLLKPLESIVNIRRSTKSYHGWMRRVLAVMRDVRIL